MEVKTIQEIKDYILKSDEKIGAVAGSYIFIVRINKEYQEFEISEDLFLEIKNHKDFNIEFENMHMFITLK